MNKAVKWVIVVFIAWWVIKDPTAATSAVHKLGGIATQAASSVAQVLSSI